MQACRITLQDNLASIASQCNSEEWDDDSELLTYSETTLRTYLENQNNIMVAVFDSQVVAGIAIGYILVHPGGNKTLYIDELDVHPNYRRQGIGRVMMKKLQAIAGDTGCSEVWLSTSMENRRAQAFYDSLHPTERKEAIIFGYDQSKKI